MKYRSFSALICGYGVPKDILEDKNYHAYLTQVFNTLFDFYQNNESAIIVNGGPTDCYKPYRRTEAGEMAKWLKQKIAEVEKLTKQKLPWKIISKPKSLSSVENLLNFRPLAKGQKIISVDFDSSTRRYTPLRTKESEQNFLKMELLATDDPVALQKIRAFMKEKLAVMRKYSAEEAHRRLPEILERLHQKFNAK